MIPILICKYFYIHQFKVQNINNKYNNKPQIGCKMTIYNNKRTIKIIFKFLIIIIIYKLIMIYNFIIIVLLWNKENLYLLYKAKEIMIILKIA